MPTLGEFIQYVRRYDFRLAKAGYDMRGPRGVTRLDYLRRDGPRGLEIVVLPDYTHDRRLTENEVRSFCRQLRIPAEDFGLPDTFP